MSKKKYINSTLIIFSLLFGLFSLYFIFIDRPWVSQWKTYQQEYELYFSDIKNSEKDIDDQKLLIKQLQKIINENQKDIQENYKNVILNSKEIAAFNDKDYEGWMLMEVQYLLNMANQKILISKDYSTSISLLNSIDKILLSMNDPKFTQLRQVIAEDRLKLLKVEEFDLNGMMLRLSNLVDKTQNLPVIKKIESEVSKNSILINKNNDELTFLKKLKKILLNAWKDLKTLIVIKEVSNPVSPLLSDQQYLLLKNNIKLLLNQAQISLINKNSTLYKNALDQLEILINQGFPTHDPLVKNFLKEISFLKEIDFDLFIIDINSSMSEFGKLLNIPEEKAIYEKKSF